MINKRGQIAIFVIIALIVIVSIAIVFVFQKRISLEKQDEFLPQNYMQQCIRDSMDAAITQMLPQGGFIDPKNFILYNNTKIEYICFNRGNYAPCVMQHPAYFNEIEKEISSYSTSRISGCYDSLKTELERRQASVNYENMNINTSVRPGKIVLIVNRTSTISMESGTEQFDSFSVETRSELHSLARVAIEIANQETQYCYFEYLGYMLIYPDIEIDKDVLSDDTKIYSITHRESGERLQVAVRGCSVSAGI